MKFSVILLLSLVGFLAGCRASHGLKASERRASIDEIGVVFRSLDSLWSTFAERQHVKVEFYPLYEYGWPAPISDTDTAAKADPSQRAARCDVGGGLGAVKSIEITTESEAERTTVFKTDSVSLSKRETKETRQKETSSETRQDNGSVAILAIVFCLAVLSYLLLKPHLK